MENNDNTQNVSTGSNTVLSAVNIPDDCLEHYDKACERCEYMISETVSHPGGDRYHSVEKNKCEQGFWEDNF